MRIVWLSWKDLEHPLAGGAELVTHQILLRLCADGHQVTFLTSTFPGAQAETETFGYKIIRRGNRFTVYADALRYYRQFLSDTTDLVIEEVNTIPFFFLRQISSQSRLHTHHVLFFHQLAREVWFHQMFFPVSLLGYLLEPLYLRMLASSGSLVLTVSSSTKTDLCRFGFSHERIKVIREGIILDRLPQLWPAKQEKFPELTMLVLGAIRPMKRTHHVIEAFRLAKNRIPGLRLIIAGRPAGRYGVKLIESLAKDPHHGSIEYRGAIGEEEKKELLRRVHVVLVTSIKEGWGLVVTEASSQGTPAVVYNVDGLRDSVRDGVTGVVTHDNTPAELADAVVRVLEDPIVYERIRSAGFEWSKEFNFDNSYVDFRDALSSEGIALKKDLLA